MTSAARTQTVFDTDSQNVSRELSTLTFSRVHHTNLLTRLRCAHWHNQLDQLGIGLPFFLVHDLGMLLSHPVARTDGPKAGVGVRLGENAAAWRTAVDRGVLRDDPALAKLIDGYQGLLIDVARSELCQKSSQSTTTDELISAVLAKIVEPVQAAVVKKGGNRKLPLTPDTYTSLDPGAALTATAIADVKSMLSIVVEARTRIRVSLEQIDLDTLKLLSMFKSDDGVEGGATEVLDLYRALTTPLANDIANFSLDLLPSVLETKKSSGVQTFSIDGYASIESRGNLDNVLPSELAYDDDLFDRRFADSELFYYGREKQDTHRERLHYILIDASASMRGLRTVFARGLALALAKKMTLKGETVWLRFFDSRLYDRQELTSQRLRIPYLLCFKAERGRNTSRVFSELERDVARLMREQPKEVLCTFITHGRCEIDDRIVESLVSKAHVTGVFVTTSDEPLHLSYLPMLQGKHTIALKIIGSG
jgi:hypothetical protein